MAEDWVLSDEKLKKIISEPDIRDLEIQGVQDIEGSWTIGVINVMKDLPKILYRHFFDIEPESKFYKLPFDYPDLGLKGFAVILHHRDQQPYEEYFAGWAPPEREADMDEWLSTMNDHIAGHL